MQNDIALVTGAATGIGAEVARQLAASGANVAVCDVNEEAGRALAESIGGVFIDCDVTDFDAVEAAVARCVAELGVPSFAHLNAGVMTVANDEPFLALEDVDLERFQRILNVNVNGVFHGLKSLLPRMRDGQGAITVTASIAGLDGLSIDPLYSATKHALIGLVRSVAAANQDSPLRINAICPGAVDTDIVPEALRAAGIDGLPVSIMATEIVSLLRSGANGEVRVKLTEAPSFVVEPHDLQVLSQPSL